MGTIFEELIRRFNEENNEEAGEHFTPRDVVKLMAYLIFLPIADQIESGTYLVYDGACGTGGMLTVAEETLRKLAAEHGKEVAIHLYGQESQPETYAISKADLLLKGEGRRGRELQVWLDAFAGRVPVARVRLHALQSALRQELENRPGSDGRQGRHRDPRFIVSHADDPEFSLITRSNDGQLMFLVNKLSKMKHQTPLGSRIAEVHNGSSLFTGDAGQGESNVRRWIIENDWLEAIIALPLNMFYNTGIATYIWVLSNRKPSHRKGKVQLIDATAMVHPAAQEPGQEELRVRARGHQAHLRQLPQQRGNRAVEDLSQRGVRLLEGDGRTARRRPATRSPSRVISTSRRPCARVDEIRADILALEQETEGLLEEIPIGREQF
jgi:type I restriction enzyme M protein